MKQWIEVSRQVMVPSEVQTIRGVQVVVDVSPHSTPKAIRGYSNEAGDEFWIEFRYLDEAETILSEPRVSRDGLVNFFLGRSSGRVERIQVHTYASYTDVVEEAERGLGELKNSEPALSRRLNLDAAKNAIEASRFGLCNA